MAKELEERMEACAGGGSRFGALSVVLADMGFFWQMYTPPYIILLIRTFLTLEGIAGQVPHARRAPRASSPLPPFPPFPPLPPFPPFTSSAFSASSLLLRSHGSS